MNRDADNLVDLQWVANCAHRLREQWPHADPTSLEEAASELWKDESQRTMAPTQAAVVWLRRGIPEGVSSSSGSSGHASAA
jgi:hypothetical protein